MPSTLGREELFTKESAEAFADLLRSARRVSSSPTVSIRHAMAYRFHPQDWAGLLSAIMTGTVIPISEVFPLIDCMIDEDSAATFLATLPVRAPKMDSPLSIGGAAELLDIPWDTAELGLKLICSAPAESGALRITLADLVEFRQRFFMTNEAPHVFDLSARAFYARAKKYKIEYICSTVKMKIWHRDHVMTTPFLNSHFEIAA